MLLKLIACNVFIREASLCVARSPHTIDVDFLELGEHVHPDRLREAIQAKIRETDSGKKSYDAILLLYGLCGNAGAGLRAGKTRLVMPRAHDCCTVLLGSRERFRELFQDNPSMAFSSVGYLERGEYYFRSDGGGEKIHYGDAYAALVEQYGQENADFIWESMHPKEMEQMNRNVVFIDIPETAHLGGEHRFREKAQKDGKECIVAAGSLRLIERLVNGDWDPADFLLVEPGCETVGVYDWTEIVRAKP